MSAEVHLRERLSRDPSPLMVQYMTGPKLRRELATVFFPQLHIHLAHGLMLMERGIISHADAAAILRTVLALYDAGPAAITPNEALEDLYSHVERHLIATLGPEVGGRLHTARSRNDLGVTQWRLALRDRLLDLRRALGRLRMTVLYQAEQHLETTMPGYTHSQHAQPVTLGYYLAAFADVLARDAVRLAAAYVSANSSPLGAAALTTTGFPIDRQATMRRLGFGRLVENAFDAVASRDDAEEAAAMLALLGVHLARVAEDLFVWCTAEFGFIEFGDEYCSVSSIMPQKKNPGVLEFVKREAGRLVGVSAGVLAGVKGSWFTDANDATDAGNEPLLDGIGLGIACLELFAGNLASLQVNTERMLHGARVGFGTMTELADTLVREAGLSFRVAHNIVGKTVAQAIAEGKLADQITYAMLDATAQDLLGRPLAVAPEAIARALDPVENIRLRTVQGGPAPAELRRMVARARQEWAADTAQLDQDRNVVETSTRDLVAAARAVVAAASPG